MYRLNVVSVHSFDQVTRCRSVELYDVQLFYIFLKVSTIISLESVLIDDDLLIFAFIQYLIRRLSRTSYLARRPRRKNYQLRVM